MNYQITIEIPEDSPQGRNIEALAQAEHLSREEAALRLLAKPASPQLGARRILGGLQQDAQAMDEAVELAMADCHRRNAEPDVEPHHAPGNP